jgi:hypothetical protein
VLAAVRQREVVEAALLPRVPVVPALARRIVAAYGALVLCSVFAVAYHGNWIRIRLVRREPSELARRQRRQLAPPSRACATA